MLGAVQPVGMDPPVIGGVQDFLEPIAVQVDHHRVGLGGFDDIIVFGEGPGLAVRNRQGLPVEAASGPAGPVLVQDIRQLIEGSVGISPAVILVADDDDLHGPVPVHVREGGGAVREVGPGLQGFLSGRAVGVTPEIHRVAQVKADSGPGFVLPAYLAVERVGP